MKRWISRLPVFSHKKRRKIEKKEEKRTKGLYIANERFDFEVSSFSILPPRVEMETLVKRGHVEEFNANNSLQKWVGRRWGWKKSTYSPNPTVFCLPRTLLLTMMSWKSWRSPYIFDVMSQIKRKCVAGFECCEIRPKRLFCRRTFSLALKDPSWKENSDEKNPIKLGEKIFKLLQ